MEKIILGIEIKTTAGSDFKKITGTLDDVTTKLKRLSTSYSGQTNSQIKALRLELEKAAASATKAGEKITKVKAFVGGGVTPKVKIQSTVRGKDLEQKSSAENMLSIHEKAMRMYVTIEKRERARALKEQKKALEEQIKTEKYAADQMNKIRDDAEKEDYLRTKRAKAKKEKVHLEGLREDTIRTKRSGNQYEKDRRDAYVEDRRRTQAIAEKKRIEKENKLRANLGTAGFGVLSLVGQSQGMLDSVNFGDTFAPALSKIMGSLGGFLGSAFATIFSEMGNMIGKLAESLLNIAANVLRGGLNALLSLLSGLAISLITVMMGGSLNIVIGLVTGILGALLQISKAFIDTLMNIFKGLLSMITSILTAVFETIKTVFTAAFTVISKMWSSFWEGLKATAQFTMDTIVSVVNKGFNLLAEGFSIFAKEERQAVKAFSQISDTMKGMDLKQGREEINKVGDALRKEFGLDSAQTYKGIFEIVSSGFRSIGEAKEIASKVGALSMKWGGDFGGDTKTITALLKAYNFTAKDTGRVTSELDAVISTGRMDFSEFTSSAQNFISSAAQAGVTIKDWGAFAVAATYAGLDFNRVSVGLNRVLQAMIDPTKQNDKAMQKVGFRFKELRKEGYSFTESMQKLASIIPDDMFREMFGTQQGTRTFRSFMLQLGDIKKIQNDINSQIGDYQRNTDMASKGWENMINSVSQMWEIFKRNIGASFGDAFRDLGVRLKSIIGNIDYSDLTKALSYIFERLASAADKMITALSKFTGFKPDFESMGKTVGNMVDKVGDILGNPQTYDYLIKAGKITVLSFQTAFDVVKRMFESPDVFIGAIREGFNFMIESIQGIGLFLIVVLKEAFKMASTFFMTIIGAKLEVKIQDVLTKILGKIASQAGFKAIEISEANNPKMIAGERNYVPGVGFVTQNAKYDRPVPSITEKIENELKIKFYETTRDIFGGLKHSIISFKTPEERIKDKEQKAEDELKEAIKKMPEVFKNELKEMKDKLKDNKKESLEKLKALFPGVRTDFNKEFERIMNESNYVTEENTQSNKDVKNAADNLANKLSQKTGSKSTSKSIVRLVDPSMVALEKDRLQRNSPDAKVSVGGQIKTSSGWKQAIIIEVGGEKPSSKAGKSSIEKPKSSIPKLDFGYSYPTPSFGGLMPPGMASMTDITDFGMYPMGSSKLSRESMNLNIPNIKTGSDVTNIHKSMVSDGRNTIFLSEIIKNTARTNTLLDTINGSIKNRPINDTVEVGSVARGETPRPPPPEDMWK